jgi:hypothetical protein
MRDRVGWLGFRKDTERVRIFPVFSLSHSIQLCVAFAFVPFPRFMFGTSFQCRRALRLASFLLYEFQYRPTSSNTTFTSN